MKGKLNKVIGDGNIVIPLYILKYFRKLNLKMDEFVFLMYLYNKQDNLDFNPEKIASDLNIDIMEAMGYISVLTDKGYVTLDVRKGETDILEEVINLDNFYEKISTFLINSEIDETDDSDDLFSFIEHKFGKTLGSIEIETIKGWRKNNINSELIKEAVQIAIDSEVYSLKYVDRILIDFKSRGITSVSELKKEKKEEKNKETELEFDTSLDDWNWLDDENEYIEN